MSDINTLKNKLEVHMRRVAIVILFLCLSLSMATPVVGQDWQGKSGIGLRGPFICPLFVGSDFPRVGGKEPYMMGWDGQFYIRYGIASRFAADLSIGVATSYDDSTATANKSFSLNKKDNAYSKLNAMLFSLTGNYYFFPEKRLQPYIILGVGFDVWKVKNLTFNEESNITDFSGKIGLGLNYWLTEKLSIDFQARLSYALIKVGDDVASGIGSPNEWEKWKTRPFRGYLEPSIGITYQIGGDKDSDGDGVPDKRDECPDTPKDCMVDAKGCFIDSDGDGICDGLDQCPNTPKGCLVDIVGCPMDSDQDGVCDGVDKCPNTRKGCQVNAFGCPVDSDGDGVCDGIDKCPNTTKGCLVDATGCPMDSDGDGVYDGLDKCPNTPKGTEVDANGCPKNVKPPVQKITLNIVYATNSYEPDAASKKVLDDLAETMKAYTGVKIEVAGFTDNTGKEQPNLVLSEKRAGAVRDYLVGRGVESDRITAKGYGMDPKYFVADNKTADGRQKNRRVEITSSEF
jgi:outer membrane protein OmpA-like peptidoglycan-associated protein